MERALINVVHLFCPMEAIMLKLGQCAKSLLLASAISIISISIVPEATHAQSADRQLSFEHKEDFDKAMTYMDAGNYAKAEKELRSLRKEKRLSPYEVSSIESMLAEAYYKQGDLDDALEHYQKAVSSGGLLPGEALSYENTIAQLLIAEGKYADGAQRLENWVRATGQSTRKNVELIMQAWVQAENYPKALPWAEQWFGAAAQKERKHYDLMNYLYSQQGASAKQLHILNQMVARWPQDRGLWDNKVSLESRSGQNQTAYQTFEIMHKNGLLRSEADLLKLAKFHEYYKAYGKGAQVLMDGMSQNLIRDSKDNQAYLVQLQTQAGL